MPESVSTGWDYPRLRDGAANVLCSMGLNSDQFIYLMGMNVSGTCQEEYAIYLVAIRAFYEHIRDHNILPAAQEKAVYAYALNIANRNCQES